MHNWCSSELARCYKRGAKKVRGGGGISQIQGDSDGDENEGRGGGCSVQDGEGEDRNGGVGKEGYEMALSHVRAIFLELDLLAFGFFEKIEDGCLINPAKES